MADQILTARNINGGTLIADIDERIQAALDSMDEYPDLKAARTITVKLTLKPDPQNERFVHTSADVGVKLPTPGRTGVAWKTSSGVKTEVEEIEEKPLDDLAALRNSVEATSRANSKN